MSERPPSAPRPKKPAAQRATKPSQPARPPSWLRWSYAVAALVSVLAVAYVGAWLVRPHRGRRGAIRVTLPEHANADAVSVLLYREGAIDRPWLFSWAMSLTGVADQIPRRTLLLRDDVSPRALLRALASGGGLVRVTIPEGFSRYEVAQRLAREGAVASEDAFVSASEDPRLLSRLEIAGASCEGYLFPDTYDLHPESAPDDVIERMVRNFRRRFEEARARATPQDPRVAQLALDERQVLTIASLVEEEAGVREDRPRVAAVFLNRLTQADFTPRLLQSDPTIVYGCRVAHPPSCDATPRTGRVSITRAMLEDSANAYNTYRHEGLPPGPISNPGRASIEAALRPANTRALFFVAMGDGRSAFADTLAEHNANVQRYLRPRR